MKRFEVLDGWRGISILLVLAGHWLPLGPGKLAMNGTVAGSGMAIFFILSGFLITNLLIRDQNIFSFLIRRFMRIIPLAWLVLFITLLLKNATAHQWASNMLFYANWSPVGLIPETGLFWSLCLEAQFYVAIALLVFCGGKKSLWLLPFLGLGVTLFRVSQGDSAWMSIYTYHRIDEILAGCTLALIYHKGSPRVKALIGKLNPVILLALLIISSNPNFGELNYLRPYIALMLIGSTLFSSHDTWYGHLLRGKSLFFIANISYAVYVIHGGLGATWLGEGDTLEKYLKRPLLALVTFVLAYVSTKYYEKYWIKLGKNLSKNLTTKPLETT